MIGETATRHRLFYLMGMPKLLFFRIQRLVYLLRDHVFHPDEAGILGGGIIDQTLA